VILAIPFECNKLLYIKFFLSREFRSDVATQFATLNESMNSNMGLILRLLQMRDENE